MAQKKAKLNQGVAPQWQRNDGRLTFHLTLTHRRCQQLPSKGEGTLIARYFVYCAQQHNHNQSRRPAPVIKEKPTLFRARGTLIFRCRMQVIAKNVCDWLCDLSHYHKWLQHGDEVIEFSIKVQMMGKVCVASAVHFLSRSEVRSNFRNRKLRDEMMSVAKECLPAFERHWDAKVKTCWIIPHRSEE